MKAATRPVLSTPYKSALPAPIVFRAAELHGQASYPRHRHAWGEFVYAYSGVMELKMRDRHYLAPPQYGVWLPPHVEHRGLNRSAAAHCSLYVDERLCASLAAQPCALVVSPLLRSVLEHLRGHPERAGSDAHQRLLQVTVDELQRAEPAGSYLPGSDDPLLQPVLMALEADPADNRSVAELSRLASATERTLLRRCHEKLGMTLTEWRQRLRVVRALPMIERGDKIEAIAIDLGYSAAPAFITMFRRRMGVTPEEFRRSIKGASRMWRPGAAS